jgi:DNA-binding SARP family transcriptional activator/Tfp pilus assembly protein PilF
MDGSQRPGADALSVGVLGPLTVSVGGRPVALTAGRLRTLLAVLALSVGEPVPTDRLATSVWDDDLPSDPKRSVQIYVTRLRSALGPDAIGTAPGGYVLRTAADRVDAARFVRLLEAAASAPDAGTERAHLLEALGLWRGTPFEDVRSTWLEQVASARLVERYLGAVERRVELDLTDGHHARLVPELRELTVRYPFRERLWGQLMLALYRSGRQGDALEVYLSLYRLLADELGVEPGEPVRELHRQILTADPALTPPPAANTHVPERVRQLPVPPPMFTGRTREVADLDRVHDASTVVISAIDGMAGIGKTALAVHLAHRIADRYPHGQLFIDLHGHTPGIAPREPAQALDYLLRALGVPGPRIPADLEDRAALYRTRLADQKMLILLDDAASETQVAPLLPGSPGCLVLITSRRRLAGLDHTHALSLDTLPAPEAADLLIRTAGEGRLGDEPPDLVAELVELCGRLPLAIRIAAARLRSHPAWSLLHLVQRLRDQQRRLSELEAGQRSVTATLDLSYQHLGAGQQRAYRLLGQHPGPDIDPYAAAALLDSTLDDARRLLDQLLDAHLLQEPTPGRYRFHDLVRAHAALTTLADRAQSTGHAEVHRLLDYYRHTASLAMDAAYLYERERRPQIPPAGTPTPDLADPTAALDWLDSERPNLLSTARYAAERGRPEQVLHLSSILHRHLLTRGHYHDAETLHRQALASARAIGHHAGELTALTGLGHVDRLQGRNAQAADHFQQALHIARVTGHRLGELDALTGLGHIHWRQGRYSESADHYQEASQIARTAGHGVGELDALTGLGHVHLRQARNEQAADHFQQALHIAQAVGYRPGELDTLTALGHLHLRQGRNEQAADHFRQALHIARVTGHRVGELGALTGLGHLHRRLGCNAQAADHFRQALHIARVTGHRVGELGALTGLAHAHWRQGRNEQAAEDYRRLLDLARESGDRNFEFEARHGLGRLRHAAGHPDAAITHHERALALADELGQPDDQARAHDGLAHAHHALSQYEQAHKHWTLALDILTRLGIDHTDDEQTNRVAIRTHLASFEPAS